MSLVPDKVRKSKKVVDTNKLDAFVDEGLASKADSSRRRPTKTGTDGESKPTASVEASVETPAAKPARKRTPKAEGSKTKTAQDTATWRKNMHRAPSVAFSVRIPTPLLERMRDVVAAVDGESLTRLLVEGASARVEEIESSYQDQVGQPLPQRRQKIEL